MAANRSTRSNCVGDHLFGFLNRLDKRITTRKETGNTRRIRAAGAMGFHAPNKRRAQKQFGLAVVKDIHCLVDTAQMAPFYQNGATEFVVKVPRSSSQILRSF